MIPGLAHFVWLNAELPWLSQLSVHSAARHGGFDKLVVHHDAALSPRAMAELSALSGVVLRPLDARELLLAPGLGLPARLCNELYQRYLGLKAPAARSNVLRIAILLREGGVYLDMDTLTLRELGPLRACAAFCGREHVAFPAISGARRRLPSAKELARASVRGVLARTPGGWRVFRRLTRYYPLAVNNAVLGAHAGHPLLLELLERMAVLSPERFGRRYALGTHLLQNVLGEARDWDVSVLPPCAFYPLGPVMSEHWFRYTTQPDLDAVLAGDSYVVHWYASLRTRAQQLSLDAATARRDAGRQLLSALIAELGLAPGSSSEPRRKPEPTKKTSPSSVLP